MSENHKPQFRGWWIPRYVVDVFQEGKISAKELILLATVDGLTQKTRGCFASNEFLASLIHVTERRLIQMITELEDRGLLFRCYEQEDVKRVNRFLVTCWAWDDLCRRRISGVIKVSLPPDESITPALMKVSPPNPPPTEEKNGSYIQGYRTSDNQGKRPRASALTGGFLFEKKATEKLAQIIYNQFHVKKDTRSWPRVFAQMQKFEQISTARIKAAIIGYGRIVGEPVWRCPVIEDAQGFRKKFISLEERIKAASLSVEKEKPQLSEYAEDVLARLEKHDFQWPHGSKQGLAQLVEASCKATRKLHERREQACREWKREDRGDLVHFDKNVCTYVLAGDGPDSIVDFVLLWVKHVNSIIQAWSDWRGQLSYFYFSPSHVDFRKLIIECGTPDAHLKVDDYLGGLTK